jgi:hypothetical protein
MSIRIHSIVDLTSYKLLQTKSLKQLKNFLHDVL